MVSAVDAVDGEGVGGGAWLAAAGAGVAVALEHSSAGVLPCREVASVSDAAMLALRLVGCGVACAAWASLVV